MKLEQAERVIQTLERENARLRGVLWPVVRWHSQAINGGRMSELPLIEEDFDRARAALQVTP